MTTFCSQMQWNLLYLYYDYMAAEIYLAMAKYDVWNPHIIVWI